MGVGDKCPVAVEQQLVDGEPFRSGAKSLNARSASSLYDLLCLDTPSWSSKTDRCSSSSPQLRLESLLHQSGNRFCADCGTPDPKWVSSNLGVFICIKCSVVHRSLGMQISKVLSVKLDEWTDEQVDNLETLVGNIAVNQKYEACIPNNLEKPKPDSSIEERLDFISCSAPSRRLIKGVHHPQAVL
ncbi:probable ADP-ribosylation factor GTPase-activating protein AGD11 [Corylus avellana]|uniref:probable ADP-ribosylation factor GTPase-activating protein AGD11 n=1 Tax=Corylus avellana TaxID=13451 RepID=UPI00286AA5C3|nr:probable ADP-ribosylation factor GTPase-activating protein AGD11 [Corylus avellana]